MSDKPLILTKDNTELFCYKGYQIETDRKDVKRYDSVLPIYPGSGVHYLIDHPLLQEGDIVLDLCTGSGVLGIYASDKASKVICTDISQRALTFAKRNADINNIKNIEFRQGDLFEPVKGEKFDYIITNPPFVPIPTNIEAALHTNGGENGLSITERILQQAETYLRPNGRMQLYSLSLGDERKSLLEDLLRKYLKNRKITMISMYSSPLPVEEFAKEFRQYAGVKDWFTRISAEGLTHLYSFIVNIEPSSSLFLVKKNIPENERDVFPDNWKNWKGRFSYWVLGEK